MSKRSLNVLIFFTIFMLCGQVIAAPFLICPDVAAMAKPAQTVTAQSEHCAGMNMEAASDKGEMDMSAMDSATMDQAEKHGTKNMQACEYFCQFWRSMTYADVPRAVVLLPEVVLPLKGDTYSTLVVSAPIEVLFRPPITA